MFICDNVAVEYVISVEEMVDLQANIAFYQEQISLQNPEQVEQELQRLLNQEIHSVTELEAWLKEETRLMEKIQEVLSGDYIAFNRYNDHEEVKKRYLHNQEVIMPLLKKYQALLDRKFYDSPYRSELDQEKYAQLIKSRVTAIELFREENIELEVKEEKLHNEYFEITGSMTVMWEGEEKTIPQMSRYMQESDRSVREKAWRLVWEEVLKHKPRLNEIMSELIQIRHQIALNAGFDHYRDYMFKKYERFDYTPEDCYQFHDSVEKHVLPAVAKIQQKHKEELGLDDYRPWDTQAIPDGQKPLRPFEQVDELINGTIDIFEQVDPAFASLIEQMREKDLLDLESRKAKSPGGFCSDLPVTGLSFIFMNAVGRQADVSTMLHEGGHCVHNLLTRDLPLRNYKSTPMESAELASMGMELFTLDKLDRFYSNEEDLKRAQIEHIEKIISFFPWAMVVDRYQHWMYENPNHTIEEREAYFWELLQRFSTNVLNAEGLEEQIGARWLMQLHIFEVPFYYIEYAIAQLGALQLWKAYNENPEQTIERYKQALALGSSKSLPEVYETAGIRFDFSPEIIQEMIRFALQQMEQINRS